MSGGSRSRLVPWILLAALSLNSFAGPFLILVVVMGGESNRWPPDRPVEWIVGGTVIVFEIVLLAACLTAGGWSKRLPARPRLSSSDSPGGSTTRP